MKACVSFVFLFVSFVSGSVSFAALSSQKVPYYGEQFYQELATNADSDEIKAVIKDVLKSYHKVSKGQPDQIVKNCNGGGECYSQYSIGYNGARVFLLGNYYLVEDGGKYAVRDVYCDNEKTEADFGRGSGPGPNKIPNPNILNVEHTWPQSRFTGRYDKGMQKADLHHLFPTDSQANSTRGNYKFGEVGKDTKPVKCGVARFGTGTDGTQNLFEPPKNHKGNVARALFYFSLRYDLPIDASEEAYLRKWAKEDPADEDEFNRNEEIFKVQKNRNPFIDVHGLEDRIDNF